MFFKIKLILILSFIFSYWQVRSDTLDSLMILVDQQNLGDSSVYYNLKYISFNHPNPNIAIEYAQKLVDLAITNKDEFWMYSGYYILGQSHARIANFEEALAFYAKSSVMAKNSNYIRGVGLCLVSIADVYSYQSNYTLALKYYTRSLKIIKDYSSHSNSLTTVFTNIGDTYLMLDSLDSALFYFQEAIAAAPAGFEKDIAINKGNIGLVYAERGFYDSAEAYIEEANAILENLDDPYAISALSVFLTYMADIYAERGLFDNAITEAKRALKIAEDLGYRSEMRDANKKLAELYLLKTDYENAYAHHVEYVALKDSINNLETVQKMADQRTEFEVGQKQIEVDLLTAEKKTQQVILIGVGALALVLIVLAVVIYQFYQSKARVNRLLENQKSELERLNQTKDKFFSIISHDLRGPVASFFGISRMIKFFVESKDTDQLLEVADNIDQSVERLSSLLDNLLAWAMQQQGQVPHHPEKLDLKEIAQEQVGTFLNMASGKDVTLTSDVEDGLLFMADKNMVQTILRNLINNALKFTPKEGEVTVIGKRDQGMVLVQVSDTGVGMPQDKLNNLFKLQDKKSTYGTAGEKGLGLGLQLVHEFIEINGGKIEVDSEEGKGTTFSIWLPLA